MNDNILEPNFNGLPKPTDWKKVVVPLQQANEKEFRGATLLELGDNLNIEMSINAQRVPAVPPGALVAGPADREVFMEIKEPGSWTWKTNPPITNAQGDISTFWWNKTDWEKNDRAALPKSEGTDVLISEEIPKGKAVETYTKPIFDLTIENNNLVNTTNFEAGAIFNSNGNNQASNNSIRIRYVKIPEKLKGKAVTVSGFGSIPTDFNIVSFRSAAGNYILASAVRGKGSSGPIKETFTIPLNGDTWAFTIANDPSNGGIGTRPHNNIYVNSFMVNEGSDALPYEPFGVKVRNESIENPNTLIFKNLITELGTGAVPASEVFKIKSTVDDLIVFSPNLIDTSADVVQGFWTNSGLHNNSVNWIKTVRKRLPQNVIDRLKNNEQVYIAVAGGGSVPSSGAYAVLWTETNQAFVKTGLGSGTYPSTFLLDKEIREYAFTIANDPSNGGIGTRPHNNAYTNSFQGEIGNVPTPYMKFGTFLISANKLPKIDADQAVDSKIFFEKIDSTRIHIYYHIGGESNRWFRINLRRFTDLAKFIDIWRLDEGWIVSKSGNTFTNIRQVILTGVWENAIYLSEPSYNNALGSSHGWEMLENNVLQFFADGKLVDIDTLDKLSSCDYLSFTTRTHFKSANGASDVATSFKKWEFKSGLLTISNNINWKATLNLRVGGYNGTFISMCSILRSDSNGNITHSAMSNEDGVVYDVSSPGFETPINTDFQNPRRNNIVLWGDSFKADVTIVKKQVTLADGTVLTNGYPNSGAYVKNTLNPNYNKIYITIGGSQVNFGDFWDIQTQYKLSNF